ncbi:MAG TPA: M20/M25/M40 family metallo-hydrolase, partial [Candidatus Nanopelagicales bacterium]|nr:M20/M25/M40 family metallo-hydrolase [Candidatus Nanopelagicales bacterium]
MTAQLIEWRHALHRIPETGFDEHRTGDAVAGFLTGLGLEPVRGIGGTGIVASVRRGTSARAIGLRADMDGLPIGEASGLDYSSEHEGRMHACGHDAHMAMVLGAG